MQEYEDNKRLFFALWPDEDIRRQLHELIPQSLSRPVRVQNLHITLVFLGDISSAVLEQLACCIDTLKSPSFVLTIDRYGWWRGPGVYWVGPRDVPQPMLQLFESIRSCAVKAGLNLDSRSFKPHATLARKVRQRPRARHTFNIHWQVDRFVLVQSVQGEGGVGVEYRVLRVWALGG